MGVTHTNARDKEEVSFMVVFMEPVEKINFAVDIVHRNRPEKNKSLFFHGMFSIKSRFNLEGRQCLKNDAPARTEKRQLRPALP